MPKGREKEAEHAPTNEEGGGGSGVERRGGKRLCMMDERWRGLQTVRCSLYLSYAFLIRRVREGWRGVGGLRGEDGIGWGRVKERRRRCYRMYYLAECCQHLGLSLMRPGGTLCR